MSQSIILKNKGLHTSPNEFSAVPEGAMTTADNVSIDVDDVVEQRRGFSRYIAFASSGDRARRYAFYQSTQIAAYSNGKIAKYSAGTWTNYSGTYSDPDASLARLNFLQALGNLYFPTNAGVYRLDSISSTPVLAGIPKALDIQASLHTSSGSAVETANQVAYRMIWGFKDANKTIFLGAASGRAVIANASGSTKDIDLVFTIPSGITTAYFFQIYRSVQSGGATIEPNDDEQLVYENNPTSGEISTGTISVTDAVPPTLLGAALYSNPSQESSLQANDRPPLADYMATFQGCNFYGKCVSKHRLILSILSASTISYNDTLVINGVTFTAKGTETVASGFYALSKVGTAVGDTVSGNNVLVNVVSTATCKIGRKISGTAIPANSFIGSFTSSTITLVQSDGTTASNCTGNNSGVTFTITPNISAYSTTSTTPAQDIADTTDSLIRVINRYASNTTVYAYLLSGYQDLPGKMLLEERGLGSSSFAVTASAGGTAFNPVLPTSGTTVSSANDNFVHQLFYSKKNKPEAVPLLNYQFVGSANNKIIGMLPLKTALYIFKEKEGIYRLTGTDPSNFQIDLFDSSAKLLAPDSLAVVNNQIWCLTDQGITTVTDTGVQVVSRPIEDKILTQTGTALTALRYYSFGVGYETDRKYILWTVSGSGDTYATQAFVFNTFTRAFTRWPINASTAAVSPDDGKLYIGQGDNEYTLQERKSLNYTDYADYSTAVTISTIDGVTITISATLDIEVGDVLVQGSIFSVIAAISNNSILTVEDDLDSWTAGAATVLKSYESKVEYAAASGGNPGTCKHFGEASLLMKAARFSSAEWGFATDVDSSFEYVDIEGVSFGAWGLFPFGESPWGGTSVPVPIRTYVPLEKQRGSLIRIQFKIREGYSNWRLNGVSLPYRDTGSFKIAK